MTEYNKNSNTYLSAFTYICVMIYENNHIREWLINHKIISISKLERACKMPKDTLRHFKEERREVPLKYRETLLNALMEYGYTSLYSEEL